MPAAGFEPTIPAGERPQTHALDRAVTGMGVYFIFSWEGGWGKGNYLFEWHSHGCHRHTQTISWLCRYNTHAMYRQQNIDFVLVYLPFFRIFNIRWGSSHRSLGYNTSEHYAVFLPNRYLKVTPIQLLLLWPLIIDTIEMHLHLLNTNW